LVDKCVPARSGEQLWGDLGFDEFEVIQVVQIEPRAHPTIEAWGLAAARLTIRLVMVGEHRGMTTWVTVATLATGSLAGVVAKTGYDVTNQKRIWRREDQHRFAAIKQEAYGQLPMLVRAYWEAQVSLREAEEELRQVSALLQRNLDADWELYRGPFNEHRRKADEANTASENLASVFYTIELVGNEEVRTRVEELRRARDDRVEAESRLEAFFTAARGLDWNYDAQIAL
jgi:hypothetical protein